MVWVVALEGCAVHMHCQSGRWREVVVTDSHGLDVEGDILPTLLLEVVEVAVEVANLVLLAMPFRKADCALDHSSPVVQVARAVLPSEIGWVALLLVSPLQKRSCQ